MPTLSLLLVMIDNPPYSFSLEMAGLLPQSTISILFTIILNDGNKKCQQTYELFYRKSIH